VWDYSRRDADGNLRQLHIDEAREALDFAPRNGYVDALPEASHGVTPLLRCPEFEVCRLDVDAGLTLALPQPHSFVALVCTRGETTLQVERMPAVTLKQGETALVPATADVIEMTGSAQLLTASVPVED